MTVATFAQPNFNVDDPTTYRTKLDGNTAVATAIVDNFAPHAVGTPNMTVQLDAGAIPGAGAMPVQVALQTSTTLTAPTTNPRNDIVYIDSATGVIGVATGTEAASPADPAVPAGKIAVARLAMTVGMSSITNSIITDLRAPAMAFGGGSTFTAISANTTLTIGQSGGRFKLTGVGTAVTLPTPTGNANTSFLLWGGDANTQTISPAASSFKMPDGTTPTSYSVTANQGIEVVSDGSVYQVVRMIGKDVGQTATPGDNTTRNATTAFVQAAIAAMATQNLAPNGYIKFPGGFTVQWGTGTNVASGASQMITFPTPFATLCAAVMVMPRANTGVAASHNYVSVVNLTDFTWVNENAGTIYAMWIAVGY